MKKSSLPNKVLSDEEVRSWCQENVPGFVGVYDRSRFHELYQRMRPGDSAVINLDPGYKHGGTHWVAVRVSSEAPIVYYKDSFGAPCPTDVVDAVEATGRGLLYGNNMDQKIDEVNCGRRAAYFLRDMANNAKKKKEIEYFEKHG